jgi:hypothetical protein
MVLLPGADLSLSDLRPALDCRAAAPGGASRNTASAVLVLLRQPERLLSARRILRRALACGTRHLVGMRNSMSSFRITRSMAAIILLVGGCVAPPIGPTVPVMPAPNKPFEVFRYDQASCMDYASHQVAGGAQLANNQQVLTGVAGTLLGAGLGAAIGGGRGAAIGAASGALAGTTMGAGSAEMAQMSLQQRYDLGYAQCMYAHGNQVPGFAPIVPPPPPPFG